MWQNTTQPQQLMLLTSQYSELAHLKETKKIASVLTC